MKILKKFVFVFLIIILTFMFQGCSQNYNEDVDNITNKIINEQPIINTPNLIPQDCIYTTANGDVYKEGNMMPSAKPGDLFETKDYIYIFEGTYIFTNHENGRRWYTKDSLTQSLGGEKEVKKAIKEKDLNENEFFSSYGINDNCWTLGLLKTPNKSNYEDILSSINNYPVAYVSQYRIFSGNHNLVEIPNIPSSITNITDIFYFSNCVSLTNAIIPEGISDISYMFNGCNGLKEVTIPDGVTDMESAFTNCFKLTQITIPDTVKNICNAFSGCSLLETINIPNGVVDISYAFKDCINLNNISIPNSVQVIGNSAFLNCKRLTNITLPNSITKIEDYAFKSCETLSNITLPNSILKIGTEAFSNCKKLNKITLPNSLQSFGSNALYECSNLKEITIQGNCELQPNFWGLDTCSNLK